MCSVCAETYMKPISATAQDICNPVSHKVSCVSIVQKNHDSDTHFCGPNDTIFDTTGLSWQPYSLDDVTFGIKLIVNYRAMTQPSPLP